MPNSRHSSPTFVPGWLIAAIAKRNFAFVIFGGLPPPKNRHWSKMLRELVLNPRADGTTPTNDELAAKLEVFRDTVMRAKKRWQKIGVIYRVNYNGVYAYNPKMLVAKDKDGNVIKHVSIDVRAASDMEAYH
jgi:hypothetical protein